MSNKFAISDTHFDHTNIIRYCNRPFKDAAEMNEAMIERWNKVVQPNDIVYHLGDFAMGGDDMLKHFERLNGQKILIQGNHDDRETRKLGWREVHDYVEVKHNKTKLCLFHYPISSWHKRDGGSVHLHGHTHNSPLESVPNRFNMGVELINYTPVNFDSIVAKALSGEELRDTTKKK